MQANLIKAFIVAAVTAVSPAAHAADDAATLAQFGVSLGLVDGKPTLAQVSLEEGGTLVIDKTAYTQASSGGSEALGTTTMTAKISPAALEVLKTKIETLSTAEIKTTESQFVCMMMPVFGATQRILKVRRGYDWNTGTFGGQLQVVDDNAGCWAHKHTTLKDDSEKAAAKELEAQLEILTIEAVHAH